LYEHKSLIRRLLSQLLLELSAASRELLRTDAEHRKFRNEKDCEDEENMADDRVDNPFPSRDRAADD
jgi:hypothetical protein